MDISTIIIGIGIAFTLFESISSLIERNRETAFAWAVAFLWAVTALTR